MRSENEEAIGVIRRRECNRLSPYLIAGLRFASKAAVARRGSPGFGDRQRYCEGGCDAVLVRGDAPIFICSECREFALDIERRVRTTLGLPPVEVEGCES